MMKYKKTSENGRIGLFRVVLKLPFGLKVLRVVLYFKCLTMARNKANDYSLGLNDGNINLILNENDFLDFLNLFRAK